MIPTPEALPEGSILFHPGFHKTGTTAVQSALASVRPAMAAEGVLYPSELRSHHRAAMAVTGRTWGWGSRGGRPPKSSYWESLRRDSTKHKGRVVISSESFVFARGESLDRIVSDLGAERMHAIFTLRPFSKLLSSSYQQYLKYGLAMPYEEWLENVFAAPPACPPSPNFWRRNDHAKVIGRWVDRLGPEHVTLLILDESDRRGLFRSFEALLGLPDGLLVPDPEIGASNRSMTAGEAETLRLVNAGGANRWDWPAYEDSVRRGAVMRMVETRKPGPDEPKIATPEWAVRAAQDFGAETAERVIAMGINILGDVQSLAEGVTAGDPSVGNELLPVQAAAEAILGGIAGATSQEEATAIVGTSEAAELTTKQAAALLKLRLEQAGRRRANKARAALADARARRTEKSK